MIPETRTIVTINTGKGDGPYARRVQLLAEGLSSLTPDVVLLQEALASEEIGAHTASALGEQLRMQVTFAPARHKQRMVEGRTVWSTSGLALLTRDPVRDFTTVALPSDPADGERIALVVRLEVDGMLCLFVNLHLSHLRGHDALRHAQLAEVLSHPWLRQSYRAQLIGGDLNTPLDRLPALLAGTSGWTWHDAYAAAAGPEPRATIPIDAAPSDGKCIDFILSVAPEGVTHPRFQNARIVLDRPDSDGIYPSDHRGVMVDLVIDRVEGSHT